MKSEQQAFEGRIAEMGNLKKLSDLTAQEIGDILVKLGSKSPRILYGHNLIYIVGNLQFKGNTYYFTGPEISAFLVVNSHEIQLFSPSVPDNRAWYEKLANLSFEFGLDLKITHVNEEWPTKSGITKDNAWQVIPRSQAEAVYNLDLLNELPGKEFAKLRIVRNKLVDSGAMQFEDITVAEPISELLKTWNAIQGDKYSKNKFEQEAFILNTLIKFKEQYPDAPIYLKRGRFEERIVSYCLLSILPQDQEYAVIHTLKGINKTESDGIHGASDATYLYVFKYLKGKGVKYINDGELGSELGTKEHKLRFMPVQFNKSYDLTYVGKR